MKKQDELFELAWQKEWQDMPEFVQEKQEPYSKLIVRFANDEDLQEFADLIGQRLNAKTKSIWHPKLVRGINSKKRYVNES
tara:strand:+ start:116 stop:358 length:243 start_codon:yes stop_codon:yes gene_type:complete